AVIRAVSEAAVKAAEESGPRLTASAKTAAKRTVKHSQREFARLKLDLRIKREPDFDKLVTSATKDVVDRFKGTVESQVEKLEKLLDEGYSMRHETLAKEVARQLEGVSASRAEFLARDAVLSINSKITTARMKAAGIEEFVWTTSQDERVRESHKELEGKTFRYDDPPVVDGETALPGEPWNCRCTAYPALPELDDIEPVEPPAPNEGTLDGGTEVAFTSHPNEQRHETTVMVDAAALERAWQLDDGYYIPPGGGGAGIDGRREAFEEFLKKEKPVQASRVNYDPKTGRAAFTDGRHRFSVLRDKGIDRVAITIPKNSVRKLPESFGAKPLRKRR
ncbi:MAG TPA: minor capsid protein, partial [Vicinamibacterales bacterium]|nr:minor capsid protein [Vicinamibacterales bacterium]